MGKANDFFDNETSAREKKNKKNKKSLKGREKEKTKEGHVKQNESWDHGDRIRTSKLVWTSNEVVRLERFSVRSVVLSLSSAFM